MRSMSARPRPLALLAASVVLGAAACAAPAATIPPTAAQTGPAPPLTGEELVVFFLDEGRYAVGTEPYEVAVVRPAGGATDRPRAVLDALFEGPTPEERARGLALVASGFTGVGSLRIADGVAHVSLVGTCRGGGATYSVANLVRANLLPFAEIAWVKVYDEHGETETPASQADSIPFCLEP